jgi:hypothetical protein
MGEAKPKADRSRRKRRPAFILAAGLSKTLVIGQSIERMNNEMSVKINLAFGTLLYIP